MVQAAEARVAAVPAAVYFWGGIDQLWEWKWGIFAAEGVLIAGMVFFGMEKSGGEEGEPEEEWEVEFREEEDRERGGIPEIKENNIRIDKEQREVAESAKMQTVLLTGLPIRYFPFIIGKNREISDLCLNLPQISRIHAKIEEDGDGYRITDLNSTNGTGVNGRFLETNESVHIEPGEMLSFADQRYRFL